MELCRGQKNWKVKVSIIALDREKARIIEDGGRTYRCAYAFPNVQHGKDGGQCAMHRDPRVDVFYKRMLARQHAGSVSVSEKDGKCRLQVRRGTYRKVKGVLYGKI